MSSMDKAQSDPVVLSAVLGQVPKTKRGPAWHAAREDLRAVAPVYARILDSTDPPYPRRPCYGACSNCQRQAGPCTWIAEERERNQQREGESALQDEVTARLSAIDRKLAAVLPEPRPAEERLAARMVMRVQKLEQNLTRIRTEKWHSEVSRKGCITGMTMALRIMRGEMMSTISPGRVHQVVREPDGWEHVVTSGGS